MGDAISKYGGRGTIVLILARVFVALRLISRKDYEHLKFHMWFARRARRPAGAHAWN